MELVPLPFEFGAGCMVAQALGDALGFLAEGQYPGHPYSESDEFMRWRKVSGAAGVTYFSDDGQWTILTIRSGEHRLCRKQQPLSDFPTLRLGQEAAEAATDD